MLRRIFCLLLISPLLCGAGFSGVIHDALQRDPVFEPVDSLEYMEFFLTGDLNGDGYGEITGRSGRTGALRIVSRGGDGAFTKIADFDGYGEYAPAVPMDTGDADRDGRMEILAYAGSFSTGARIQVWEASGEGNFPSILTWELVIPAGICCLAKYGDMDGDGLTEITVLERAENDPFFVLTVYEVTGGDKFDRWPETPRYYACDEGTPGDMGIFFSPSAGIGGVLLMWHGYSRGSVFMIECAGDDDLGDSASGFDLGYLVFCTGRLNLLPGEGGSGFAGDLLFGVFNTVDSFVLLQSPVAGCSMRWKVPDRSFWKSNDVAAAGETSGRKAFICNAARGQYLFRADGCGEYRVVWKRETPASIVLPYCISLCDLDRNGRGEIILSEWDNSNSRLLVLEERETGL